MIRPSHRRKIGADWPGLGPGQLLDDRDLRPTADLRAVAKGVLAGHMGIRAASLGAVFPDSATAPPMAGLIRA